MKNLMRWLVGVVGLALLAIGAQQVIEAASAGGAVALVVAGSLLLISPFIIDRLEQLSLTSTGLELRLSVSIAELGAPDAAQILERTGITSFAESYAFIYEELRDRKYQEARVYLQDLLVERTAAIARQQKFKASEVRTLFANGSPVMRVLALGLMEGDPSLADGATINSAIADSRSGNEQYHGLKLALLCWRQLSTSDRNAVRAAIADNPYIRDDPDREGLAEELRSLPTS
jgi:hypothetical protein